MDTGAIHKKSEQIGTLYIAWFSEDEHTNSAADDMLANPIADLIVR